MNTKNKGDISETAALAELTKREYTVCIPFGDNARYDFIAEKDNILERIQVKTGSFRKGVIIFNIKNKSTKNGKNILKDYIGDIDYFLVYSIELNKIYKIDIELTRNIKSNSMELRVVPPKNGQIKNITWAKDFEF